MTGSWCREFQPTLPLRGATRDNRLRALRFQVSTHAPLAGSDCSIAGNREGLKGVSTHAPLAGSDLCRFLIATHDTGFNPRSPCGERPTPAGAAVAINPVSTHAPLAGSDTPRAARFTRTACFNPRSPCGERREPPLGLGCPSGFNPRSPCGERRLLARLERSAPLCFNPRSPCGERPYKQEKARAATLVSTHAPLAGSDLGGHDGLAHVGVSTHAPLAGSDAVSSCFGHCPLMGFNPRSPCGERLSRIAFTRRARRRFNPRSPCGERPRPTSCRRRPIEFQPTLPLRGATATSC